MFQQKFKHFENKKIQLTHFELVGFLFCCFLLSDQGSNLDSTDPESVVLPITPSDTLLLQNYNIFQLIKY